MNEFHIQDSSNCCRHKLKQPISQKIYSWRVFDIWPICAAADNKSDDCDNQAVTADDGSMPLTPKRLITVI